MNFKNGLTHFDWWIICRCIRYMVHPTKSVYYCKCFIVSSCFSFKSLFLCELLIDIACQQSDLCNWNISIPKCIQNVEQMVWLENMCSGESYEGFLFSFCHLVIHRVSLYMFGVGISVFCCNLEGTNNGTTIDLCFQIPSCHYLHSESFPAKVGSLDFQYFFSPTLESLTSASVWNALLNLFVLKILQKKQHVLQDVPVTHSAVRCRLMPSCLSYLRSPMNQGAPNFQAYQLPFSQPLGPRKQAILDWLQIGVTRGPY